MPHSDIDNENLFQMTDRNESSKSYPTKEAQIDMLGQLVEFYANVPFYVIGDTLEFFACSGPLTRDARTGLIPIFWRYLHLSPGYSSKDEFWVEDNERIKHMCDTEAATLPFVDCMIAYYTGTGITFGLACSALLRRVEKSEHSDEWCRKILRQ